MSNGQFFKLCNNSASQNGDLVYNYKKVYQKKSSISYPVYVIFHKNRIGFYFTGELNRKKEDSKKTIGLDFLDTILFELPYYEGNKTNNELNTTLDWIVNAEFPLAQKYSISKDVNFTNKSWYYNDDNIKKQLGFINNEEDANLKFWQKLGYRIRRVWQYLVHFKKGKNDNNGIRNDYEKLFLRELFLDFLFDFNHTELFKSSPYFSRAKSQLFQNFYFEATSAKLDFYYNLYVSNNDKIKKVNSKVKDKWARVLMKSGAENIIHRKKNKKNGNVNFYWFQDIEKELYSIYKKTDVDSNDKANYSLWLAQRNNIVSSFSLIFNLEKFKSFPPWLLIISFIASFVFAFYGTDFQNTIQISLIIILFFISLGVLTFFFSFCILGIYKLNRSFQLILFSLTVILFSSWLLVSKSKFILEHCLTNNDSIETICYILFPLTFFMILSNERTLRPLSPIGRSFLKTFGIMFLASFYSITISLIAGSITLKERFFQDDILQELWVENIILKSDSSRLYNPNGKKLGLQDTLFYLDNISKPDTSSIISIIKKNKLSKSNKLTLFNNLSSIERQNGDKIMHKYEGKIFRREFDLYIINTILLAYISISLFIGVFIQIIIQRKPLSG